MMAGVRTSWRKALSSPALRYYLICIISLVRSVLTSTLKQKTRCDLSTRLLRCRGHQEEKNDPIPTRPPATVKGSVCHAQSRKGTPARRNLGMLPPCSSTMSIVFCVPLDAPGAERLIDADCGQASASQLHKRWTDFWTDFRLKAQQQQTLAVQRHLEPRNTRTQLTGHARELFTSP